MSKQEPPYHPPRWLDKLLEKICAPHLLEEVMGDLHERYYLRVQRVGEAKARKQYWREVLAYMRPYIFKRKKSYYSKSIAMDMFKNYFKIALRNMAKQKVYSFINIGGLAIGMAVAMLIGLWIWDEFSFNKYHQNYDRIAQVWQQAFSNGRTWKGGSLPIPLGTELRSSFSNHFEFVVMTTQTGELIISSEDKKFTQLGRYMQPEAPEMLSLKMLYGTRSGLKDPHSILLSASLAKKLFGEADPINKIVQINNIVDVKVTGVYEDLPKNTEFNNVTFIAPWDLYISYEWVKNSRDDWNNNFIYIYAQIPANTDFDKVSAIIKDVKLNHVDQKEAASQKPELFLHPMRDWHLYSEFDENGVNVTSEQMKFIWFYGIIGVFVLLLACINFMNLSTARSEKRAKEVGIRKAIGSLRSQLISQFFSESLLVSAFAFVLSIILVQLALPWFNGIADKEIAILWENLWFWLGGLAFTFLTGLLAGTYPALYLSSFNPVKALKGVFRAGRFSAISRKVLVVVQFTVSVALMIGTIIVFQQIQFAKNRPVGYSRDGLLQIHKSSPDFYRKYDVLRNELKNTGVVAEMAESASPLTIKGTGIANNGFDWKGKDPAIDVNFGTYAVTHEYGKTTGWQLVDGRDFSKEFASDSSALVINEAAARYMELENPVGEIVSWDNQRYKSGDYRIIGVVKDMVMRSPFEPMYPTVFFLQGDKYWIFVKIDPNVSVSEALPKIEAVFTKLIPSVPFDYKFVNDEYDAKFRAEERIGKLAGFFAIFAVFICCLGLFGLASFVAEQRTKEIGIRKVLGASVANIWRMLSKDFVVLVMLSCLIAIPIAYYFLHAWLQNYAYRTEISWWIFASVGVLALTIALLTVSFQAIKAALGNPVDALRNE